MMCLWLTVPYRNTFPDSNLAVTLRFNQFRVKSVHWLHFKAPPWDSNGGWEPLEYVTGKGRIWNFTSQILIIILLGEEAHKDHFFQILALQSECFSEVESETYYIKQIKSY